MGIRSSTQGVRVGALFLVSVVVLAASMISVAQADLAGCNNCITQDDIANGAVGSGELQTGAVKSVDIKDRGVQLKDISPKARPAASHLALTGTTSATTPTTLDQFIVTVPGPGLLLVSVHGAFWDDTDAPGANSVMSRPFLGICTTADSNLSCGGSYAISDYVDPDNAVSVNAVQPFTRSAMFDVSAGNLTIYLNGQADQGTLTIGGGTFNGYASADVMFFPAGLNVTSAPSRTTSGSNG